MIFFMLIQDNTRKYQDRHDVCTSRASRFFKWREDDEQEILKTALMQQDIPSIGLLEDNDIYGM